MKKFLTLLFAGFLCCSGFACGGGGEKVDPGGAPAVPDGYEKIEVSAQSNKYELEGLGAQMDQCIFSGGYLMNAVSDPNFTEADYELLDRRLAYMKIDLTRVAVVPEWWEPVNDNGDPDAFDADSPNLTWESPKMKALYKVLDLCKKHGIKVNFSLYGVYPSSWNASQNPPYPAGWLTCPESDEEFAESLSGALRYLTEVKGYDNINEFSVYPEPDTMYVESGRYQKLVEACDAKLRKEGIRDRFLFSGPAEVSNYNVYEKVVQTVGPVFDKLTGSFYKFNNATTNFEMISGMKPFAVLADTIGKSYGVSEFGSNLMISAAKQQDTDSFDRALYLARFAATALSQGFSNLNYWVLADSMYDGTLMELGLWKYKNDGWAFRPQFYAYSLLTRYTEPGSKIYASDLSEWDSVSFSAFRTAGGKWTYVVVNNGENHRKLAFVNPNFSSGTLTKYEVTENSLPDPLTMEIGASRTHSVNDRVLSLAVKSRSVTVLTEL